MFRILLLLEREEYEITDVLPFLRVIMVKPTNKQLSELHSSTGMDVWNKKIKTLTNGSSELKRMP